LDGVLRGIPHVYVADGSILPYLPAKGLTLTLMANADRIGTKVLQALCAASSIGPSVANAK
jgi:choline dehydrogenase-like flavoprotein